METAKQISGWVCIILGAAPIVLGIGWSVWELIIAPMLIPREEIVRIADQVMRDHPEDPQEWAFMEEHAAWFRSHTVEQGKWRRVRRELRRRLR
jgi:beta-galactosidase/beta-glucuronidase